MTGRHRADAADLGFAPADPVFIADPYPVLARLRSAGAAIPYAARGVHLLTRFDDVHAALRDRRLGRAYRHRYTDDAFGGTGPDPRWPRWNESERWSLLNLEPPDHTRLRRLVSAVFTAKTVATLRPWVQELARTRVSALPDSFDLITGFAQPFSVSVICRLLGLADDAGPDLLRWSHAIVKMYEFDSPLALQQDAEEAADEFIAFVQAQIAQRRRDPGDDLVSELVAVSDGGDRLTEDEIIGTVIVLLNAGHEASVNTLGNGLSALLQRPDQWERIVCGQVSAEVAVEEMIRFDAPLQLFERWVLDDGVELGGRVFAAGERIALLFGSANRDPARFTAPDEFRVDRGDSTHIGFGGGLHFCIGAPLARLEIAAAVQALAAVPGLRMAELPTYQPHFVIRGLAGLRLTTGGPAGTGAGTSTDREATS